jgi:hypothetical protein
MSVVDFRFDNLSRIQYDNSTFTQSNRMNSNLANYTLFNPFNNDCNGGINFATQQPNVFVNGTRHIGPLGCNINESTQLEKAALTNPHIKISLHERPYKTVPYLGKGNVDVGQENDLRLGDTFKEKKSISRLNENPYINLNNYPLHGRETMTDSSRCIEHDALSGWVRGGIGSREMYKTGEYCKKK